MEEISRYRGAYLASYAVPASSGFYGYCKIGLTEPDSVWDARDVQFKVGSECCPSAKEAMRQARTRAQILLDRLDAQYGKDFLATMSGGNLGLFALLHLSTRPRARPGGG